MVCVCECGGVIFVRCFVGVVHLCVLCVWFVFVSGVCVGVVCVCVSVRVWCGMVCECVMWLVCLFVGCV